MRATYLDAGKATAENLPTRLAVVRFGGRNLRAEAWLRDRAVSFVTRILEDQRAAIRDVLVAGMAAGTGPKALTVRIVGRISRISGKREGGILGLSSPQARSVASAQAELTSADPALLRHYLTRTRRDRRFDRSITKALREGRAVPADIASKAITAYERRLLALRAETIARTEAMTALHGAQQEALQQAVDSGALQANQVRRVWRSAGDRRVRHTHQAMNGDSAGLHEVFVSPSGAALRFPGDPLAPVGEVVNCRCWCEPRIDFYSNIA
ncbi:Phage Mu protein F like protein [compost metagenome]